MATPRRMAIRSQRQTAEILERVEAFEAEIKALSAKIDALLEAMAKQTGPPKTRATKK